MDGSKVKIMNLLYQPLELVFEESTVRLKAREIVEIDKSLLETDVFKRARDYVKVIVETDTPKKKESQSKKESRQ